MTLTREAITRSVFDRLDLSKIASAKAVEATFEIIKKTLQSGDQSTRGQFLRSSTAEWKKLWKCVP